jgi:hypothetical protein
VSCGGAGWTPNNMLCLSMNMQLHYLAHQPLIVDKETVTCIFDTNSIFKRPITKKRLHNLQLLRNLEIINNKSFNFCLISFMSLKYTVSVKFACNVCVCECACACVCMCARTHVHAHQSMSIQSQQFWCSIYFMYKYVFCFLHNFPIYSVIFILYCIFFSLLSLLVSMPYVKHSHSVAEKIQSGSFCYQQVSTLVPILHNRLTLNSYRYGVLPGLPKSNSFTLLNYLGKCKNNGVVSRVWR